MSKALELPKLSKKLSLKVSETSWMQKDVSRETIIQGMFEPNSSLRVKWCTTGKAFC